MTQPLLLTRRQDDTALVLQPPNSINHVHLKISKFWSICSEKGNDPEQNSKVFTFVSVWVISDHVDPTLIKPDISGDS